MIYKATIHIFVDVEDESEACDCIAEALRPLLRRYCDEGETNVVEWSYADDGKAYSYPVPASEAEIAGLDPGSELDTKAVEAGLEAHYTKKFNGKVWALYDEDRAAFCIRGEGLPAAPELRHLHPNGWSLLDYITPAKARALIAEDRKEG